MFVYAEKHSDSNGGCLRQLLCFHKSAVVRQNNDSFEQQLFEAVSMYIHLQTISDTSKDCQMAKDSKMESTPKLCMEEYVSRKRVSLYPWQIWGQTVDWSPVGRNSCCDVQHSGMGFW